MSLFQYALGAVAGLAFGSLIAYLNSRITKKYLNKNKDKSGPEGAASAMGVSALRMLISVLALAAVFFTRKLIPLPFTATIIGAAVGLTAVSFAFLWHLTKHE